MIRTHKTGWSMEICLIHDIKEEIESGTSGLGSGYCSRCINGVVNRRGSGLQTDVG